MNNEELKLHNGGTVKWVGSSLRLTFSDGGSIETQNFTTVLMYEFLLRFIEQDAKKGSHEGY